LATQVEVGPEDGLKHESSIHCDALVSLPKTVLTDYVASLPPARVRALDQALRVALALA
jgi:mRNA interferase MazF